ncbi:MAG: VPS10 domain-containing protein, partial [Fimbriimonas sp.]
PLGRIGLSYGHSNPKVVVATVEYKPLESEKDRPREGRAQVLTYAGGTFRSEDGGESWTRVNYLNPRPFYFSNPKVDPLDPSTVYVAATDLRVSTDGGKTFKVSDNRVHPDYHAFWIDPTNSNTLLVGTDGGVFMSHDKGAKWRHLNGMVIGQYYAVAADNRRPYWIWGGLQDNQSWGIPTQGKHAAVNFYDTENLGGGDGFHAQVDPDDWSTVYWESQGGSISRTDLKTGRSRGIGPRQSNIPLRFNWSTPFIISPHNAKTLYLGSNVLFKSINRGDSWKAISPDLTTNDPAKQKAGASSVTPEDTGAERHCTIVTVGESPARAGILWVGTDDGLVHVSQDDGVTWTNVTSAIPDLPANLWCTRVLPSRYADGRAYVTFSGHRSDDFRPYVYVTEDFGKTWSKLNAGLPEGDSVYAIQEGRKNSDLLFLGSEMSLRVSLDRGKTWTRFRTNFPTVAVHDLLIHPRELDLIIGTHGRSIWTLDVSALEQLTSEALSADAAVFKPQDVLLLGRSSSQSQWIGDDVSGTRNSQPGTTIYFHLKAASDVKLSIYSTSGEDVNENSISGKAGLNAYRWNGRIGGVLPPPGSYKVVLTAGGKEYVTTVTVAGVSGSSGADAPENEDEDGK